MNVAILGLGVVGRGVYDILQEQQDIHVSYVLERHSDKTSDISHVSVPSIDAIVQDESVDVVIELIGGTTSAYTFIKQSLQAGKHVVTANKAVISKHFKELHDLANEYNVSLCYEASVGGAIIVLDSLYSIAHINHIHQIEGIVNGATNFILTNIYQDNVPLQQAIDNAYNLGYLETGTTDDMDGLDAMRKINILSMISYQGYLAEEDVLRVPLGSITSEFHKHVREQRLTMKYIATSMRKDQKVSMTVMPVIVSNDNEFAQIQYELNSIKVYGTHHKAQTFIGQGAGRYPTASAVVFDVLSINQNTTKKAAFPTTLTIDNDMQLARYLVQRESGYVITEPQVISDIINDETIVCFARWEVSE